MLRVNIQKTWFFGNLSLRQSGPIVHASTNLCTFLDRSLQDLSKSIQYVAFYFNEYKKKTEIFFAHFRLSSVPPKKFFFGLFRPSLIKHENYEFEVESLKFEYHFLKIFQFWGFLKKTTVNQILFFLSFSVIWEPSWKKVSSF